MGETSDSHSDGGDGEEGEEEEEEDGDAPADGEVRVVCVWWNCTTICRVGPTHEPPAEVVFHTEDCPQHNLSLFSPALCLSILS